MLTILSMLLSAAVDTDDATARRARLHELRGRLGLRRPQPVPGTRSRLQWALVRWKVEDPSPYTTATYRWPARDLLFMVWALTGYISDDPELRSILGVPVREPGEWEDAFFDHLMYSFRMGRVPDDVLPPEGYTSRFDRYIPWFASIVPDLPEGLSYSEYMGNLMGAMPELSGLIEEIRERVGPVIDWADATSPDLMGMSWSEAEAASDAWHGQLVLRPGFRKPLEPGRVVAHGPHGITVQALTTKRQLRHEGTAMGHCVAGYWKFVRDGEALIFSVRDADGLPWVTLEVEPVFAHHRGTYDFDALSRMIWVKQAMGPEDAPYPLDKEQRIYWHVAGLFLLELSACLDWRLLQLPGALSAFLGMPQLLTPEGLAVLQHPAHRVNQNEFDQGLLSGFAPAMQAALTEEWVPTMEFIETSGPWLIRIGSGHRSGRIAPPLFPHGTASHPSEGPFYQRTDEEGWKIVRGELTVSGHEDLLSALHSAGFVYLPGEIDTAYDKMRILLEGIVRRSLEEELESPVVQLGQPGGLEQAMELPPDPFVCAKMLSVTRE